ncbi:MAG TPA: semialdehyde dehydrogenase [Clostridiales bacterium]|nr:semialdehyde dehydrogenase [Clostridiales bacterium]
MKKIVVIGAGGKMGCRVSKKLMDAKRYDAYFCEVNEASIERLKAIGINTISKMEEIVPQADYVLLSIPDILIGKLSKDIIPLMKPGAMVIGLDPAAAYAGVMPIRDDIGYFVVHPHHPYLFNTERDEDGNLDFFGGKATQDVSCALYHGDEHFYAEGEQIARVIFAPVGTAFRVTVKQMGFCEPGLVESISAPLVYALKQAYEAFVAKGVPADALYSFLMGHLRVQFAITFGLIDARYSDGAILALNEAMSRIFKDNWLETMVNEDFVTESIMKITDSINKK